MAKKINENELNNVSGGCGGGDSSYRSEMDLYDYNNRFIKTHKSLSKKVEEEAKNSLNQTISDLFALDRTLQYVKWRFYKDGQVIEEGTKYR